MERSFVRRRTPRRLLIVVGLAIVSLVLAAGGAGAAAASPTVEGEITGGNGSPVVAAAGFDLATVGYEQSEFLLSGTATAYTAATPLPNDGKWGATPSDVTADYKTRVVVYRPTNANRFNGNVIVEWLNVSGGLDAGPDWTLTHTQLFREGAVWVGVSAQKVGLDATVAADAARYAAIPPHPGDSFSYDIYSQAGQAIWDNADDVARWVDPAACDRDGRVAVGRPAGDLLQRGTSARRRLRRLPRAQPERRRRGALAGASAEHRADEPDGVP